MRKEDVIDPAYMQQYEEEHQLIKNKLIYINTLLFIVEKILTFPFRLFEVQIHPTFWNITARVYIATVILELWTLIGDKESTLTIRSFKNRFDRIFIKHDISPDVKKEFQSKIEKVYFEGRVKKTENKIREIRHHYIAHNNYQVIANNSVDSTVTLKELMDKRIRRRLTQEE